MTSALDPALYELTELTEALTADTPTVRRRRRARARRFVKGPIPIGWLKACSRASPRAIQLACVILMRTGRAIPDEDQVEIAVTEAVGNDAGLSRDQRRDAVLGLEAEGLLEIVDRRRNHAFRVRLKPWRSFDAA